MMLDLLVINVLEVVPIRDSCKVGSQSIGASRSLDLLSRLVLYREKNGLPPELNDVRESSERTVKLRLSLLLSSTF